MESREAVAALSALAHPGRLAAFRLLVSAGEDGLEAGRIASGIDALPNTTSTNLGLLEAAGLISSRREGRNIRYFVDFAATRDLLRFLIDDCCGGRPEICGLLETSTEARAC